MSEQLNPNLWKATEERRSTRAGFGEGLVEAAREDERVVGLCADVVESVGMGKFREEFPNRYVEVGVAEQNLVSVASGLAAMGKVPFAASYAVFSPGRNWEQVRTTICYNDRNVKIVGSHAGVSVGADGATHQALEDIALMRVLPRMTVVVPCDAVEAKKATIAAAKFVSPVYLRLAREKTPVITTEATPFIIGRANVLRRPEKPQVAIFACGPVLYNALLAAEELEKNGIAVSVTNLHTIKPLDTAAVFNLVKEAGAVVTVEEHQRAGGLGSAVAEFLAGQLPVPMEILGIDDQFGQSGKAEELIKYYGLGAGSIKAAVERVLKRKA